MSSMLTGAMQLGAAVLATGGLVVGVYALSQAGGNDEPSSVQAPTAATGTLEEPDDLSPPEQVEGPTPTFPPAPITPLPPDEVADWPVYRSPLGITLRYPPTWTVVSFDVEGLPEGRVRIMNEKAKTEHDRRVADGVHEGDVRTGELWVQVTPDQFPTFDAPAISASCEAGRTSTGTRDAELVNLAGLPAVRCTGSRSSEFNPEQTASVNSYSVRLPSGRVLGIAVFGFNGRDEHQSLSETIVSSLEVVE